MSRLLRLPFRKCRNSVGNLRLVSHPTMTEVSMSNHSTPDWDADDSLFTFTRGRFVYDEEHQMAQRRVRFSTKELARVAASSIGADRCVHIQKCPDGLYNKAYIFRMDDGREVIGKVPNPNAGLPHYSTASEVATMDYMRSALSIPAPKVLAWNSRPNTNHVGSEYIIMEKAEGVPSSRVWAGLGHQDRFKLLLQVFGFMKAWAETPLPGYGGLYYAEDVPGDLAVPLVGTDQDANGHRFVIGPAVGRDWCDAGRKELDCDRGPWLSALEYRRAVGAREQAAVQHLPADPKQWVMLKGPGLYQPSPRNKLWALNAYLQVLEHVLPTISDPDSPDLLRPRLWHDDLHRENIFVNPASPTEITAIIDWQSTQAVPLFDHSMDPAFFDYDGPDIGDNLEKPGPIDTTGLSPEEKAAAITQHLDRAIMIAWRLLARGKSPAQYQTTKLQDTTAGHILRVARRAYEIGETHLAALMLDLRDEWPESGGSGFPILLSPEEEARIKRDVDGADMGASLIRQVKSQMGEQWPEKGLAEHEAYDETKDLLTYVRDEIAGQCWEGDEAKQREFKRGWPFDT